VDRSPSSLHLLPRRGQKQPQPLPGVATRGAFAPEGGGYLLRHKKGYTCNPSSSVTPSSYPLRPQFVTPPVASTPLVAAPLEGGGTLVDRSLCPRRGVRGGLFDCYGSKGSSTPSDPSGSVTPSLPPSAFAVPLRGKKGGGMLSGPEGYGEGSSIPLGVKGIR